MLAIYSFWLLVLGFSLCDVGPCCAADGEGDKEMHCTGYEKGIPPNETPWRVVWYFEPASGTVPKYTFLISYNYETKLTETAAGSPLSDRIKILSDGDSKHSLFIESFSLRDSGTYTCRIYARLFRTLYETSITVPESSAISSGGLPIIIGAAVAGIFVVVVIITVIYFVRRRRKYAAMQLQESSYTGLKMKDSKGKDEPESHYEMIAVHDTYEVIDDKVKAPRQDEAYQSLNQQVVEEGTYDIIEATQSDAAGQSSPEAAAPPAVPAARKEAA